MRPWLLAESPPQVFRNDEPWIRSQHDGSEQCVSELSRFSTVNSTTCVPREPASVSFGSAVELIARVELTCLGVTR